MYDEYFGLSEEPFGITPDPRFYYENPIYREAYTTLASGVTARRGLMTLVGEVGTGKTTVLRHLMANSEPGVRCVLADYPPASFDELLTFTCRELGVLASEPRSRLDQITALKQALLPRHADTRNGTTALLLDEAQHLTEETLEGIRLLSNLESGGDKLLQVVLAGQPELSAKLDQPSLAPLKQRITFECRLDRLSYEEIAAYVEHRLAVAGYRGHDLFAPDAVEAIGFYSNGIPRLINVICGNALLRAHRVSQRRVSSTVVVDVARALRIGPAFEYRAARPIGAAVSSPSETSPDPISLDPPAMRFRGRLYEARATVSRRQSWRPDRWSVTRRWLWASLGCLACILVGTAGVALLRTHYSAVAINEVLTTPRPATVPVARSEIERAGSLDSTGLRPPENTATPSSTAAGEDIPLATGEATESPAAGAAAGQADARETRITVSGEAIAERVESAVATAGSSEDAAERAPVPVRSRPPARQVILQRGATISGIVWNAFGPQMFLALDLLKELNPHIDNLNWVLAGQQLRLPRLGRDDLVRAHRDGSYRLILNSLPNPADARALSETVHARGYDVVITPRQVSNDLVLSRVEIRNLRDQAAARRAWETAVAAAWLPRPIPAAEGDWRPRP